jgi:hypothetical protein
MLTDEIKRYLTEEVLHECWHRSTSPSVIGAICACQKVSFNVKHADKYNRAFTTQADTMALYSAIFKVGRWEEFHDFVIRIYKQQYNLYNREQYANFNSWLFCLSGEGYEERCRMVEEFRKGDINAK